VTRHPDGARAHRLHVFLAVPVGPTARQLKEDFMHRLRRHVTSRLLPALCVAALLAVVCSGASIASGTSPSNARLGGAWSGSYSGSYAGTFTIHWTQGRSGALKGSIALSNPHGTYPINGKVNRNVISFGAVGVGAVYNGSVGPSGRSMSGHWRSGDGGSGSWSARKISRG
jgi:hypothetical protein